MHAVLSFAELGQSKVGGDPARLAHYFERIRQSGQRLLQMLNDLLDLSKLEAGKMVYTMQPLSLARVLADLQDEFSQLAALRRIRLESEAPPGLPEVNGDSFRLAQVFQNLIANAIKFSPEGGVVWIRFTWDDHFVTTSVEDEGIGVPPDEVERIFDKFIQSSKTKTGAGGTGLGLAICREIITAHGGQIRCENRHEGGARFVFTLPRRSVSPAETASHASP
jgi:signal transduction histidine kinase